MATIRTLKESGLSIVLVEQNPTLVFDVADDVVMPQQRPRGRGLDHRGAQARQRQPEPASRRVLGRTSCA
jgi:ABC-type branched-subunit amino acid transport system ATPase component